MQNANRRRRILSVLPPEKRAQYRRKPRKPTPPSAEEIERREQWDAWRASVENGGMRTVAWPHISHDDHDESIYEFSVPHLALAELERWRDGGTTLLHVKPFCESRGIEFVRCRWSPEVRKLGEHRGMHIMIYVFKTVEDQRTVATAFPGRLF